MLIIDIYTIPNTLKNKKSLAKLVARVVKNIKKDKTHGNVLCLIHETDALSNDNGEDNYIHSHIIHSSGELNRSQQSKIFEELTYLLPRFSEQTNRISISFSETTPTYFSSFW
ncbi:hypothetical protein [Lactococcus protaetiae]|uniref:Uncharacterized protein n=1 Tax=Lactococcus protaetiae TaxID=2592653 RepID=A0A514Z9U8_9LACT|nr:hypothetical protein [Lactococcus protaetiae]MCL2113811.1 hypothetical protein [Streptococcaceae bacterium]QDK71335.1 hypothetical protein FLP15_09400 [Lactococcus protaetiae]